MSIPARMDPEVAARVFSHDLGRTLASDQARREGWTETRLGPLHTIIHMDGVWQDGTRDAYHLLLIGDWYDEYPPQGRFVVPPSADVDFMDVSNWPEAPPGSPWLPKIDNATLDNKFAFHPIVTYAEEGIQRQLICTSMSFDYYITGHAPTDEQRWKQGRHTVSALLTRVQIALKHPSYLGRTSALDT